MADIWEPIFLYCERKDASLLAEPFGLTSNILFLVAAFLILRLAKEQASPPLRALGWLALAVGLGSGFFHSWPNRVSQAFDVLPIGFFAATFIAAFFAELGKQGRAWKGRLITVLILVGAPILLAHLSGIVPLLNHGEFYLGLAPGMLFLALTERNKKAGRYLVAAAILFLFAYSARTVDIILCQSFPIGTHFIWHSLTACVMLTLARSLAVLMRKRLLSEQQSSQ